MVNYGVIEEKMCDLCMGEYITYDRLLSPPERDPAAFVPAQFSLQVRSDQLRDLRSGHRESG